MFQNRVSIRASWAYNKKGGRGIGLGQGIRLEKGVGGIGLEKGVGGIGLGDIQVVREL